MKRTMKIWLTVVVNGMLLAGRAGMTGQTSWVMETQTHSDRIGTSGSHRDNRNASGLRSYRYHYGGHPAYLHPNEVYPYAGGGENTRIETQIQTKIQTRAQIQAQTQAQAAIREISGAGEVPGTSDWCQNGAQWNYICEDGTRLIGHWKQVDGIWHCFDGDRNIRAGWYEEDGSLYYLGTDKRMTVGACVIDEKEHQFDQDGKMIQPDSE